MSRWPERRHDPLPSLRATGSRECAPDDRLREASIAPAVIASAAKQSIAPAVIASEAKQSILPRKERMDCFVAALLAMTGVRGGMKQPSPVLATLRPRASCYFAAALRISMGVAP